MTRGPAADGGRQAAGIWRQAARAPALVALVALSGLANGCATIHRPPVTVASLTAEAPAFHARERATTDSIIARLARRAAARGDRQLDILLLSGGGQHGAYGAGFIRGWRSRSDAPMPLFDLVSGISTGGLQAPFVLVNRASALDTLSELYRQAVDRFAPGFDWWFWLRRTGGVSSMKRFNATVTQVYDEPLADELRREFAAGRQLVIGTTDMDIGAARTWDLREVLRDSSGLGLAHRVLRATSSIPGYFPPLILDGHVHSDGGLISNVMPVLGLDDYRRLAARLRAEGIDQPVTVRLWVIMNLFLASPIEVANPNSRGAMSARGAWLQLYGHQPQLVDRLHELARAATLDVPGLRLELHLTALPPDLATEPGANAWFHREWMVRLEQVGFERARGERPWDLVAPALPRP